MKISHVVIVSLLFIIGNCALRLFEEIGLPWNEIQWEYLLSDMITPLIVSCFIPLTWFLSQYLTKYGPHVQAGTIALGIAFQLISQTKGVIYPFDFVPFYPLQIASSVYFFYIATFVIQKYNQISIYHLVASFFVAQIFSMASYYVNSVKYGHFTSEYTAPILIIIPILLTSCGVCTYYYERNRSFLWIILMFLLAIAPQSGVLMGLLHDSRWYIPLVGLSSSIILYLWALHSLPFPFPPIKKSETISPSKKEKND